MSFYRGAIGWSVVCDFGISWSYSLDYKYFLESTRAYLTLIVPRKKMHLKMSSAEVVCCKQLPNITDELSIEANSVDPEQTAPIGAV